MLHAGASSSRTSRSPRSVATKSNNYSHYKLFMYSCAGPARRSRADEHSPDATPDPQTHSLTESLRLIGPFSVYGHGDSQDRFRHHNRDQFH